MKKKVYYTSNTSNYQSDQGISDTLSIAAIVLDRFKEDSPNVVQFYAKSDNAPSYKRNYVLEALDKLCSSKGISLKLYNYPTWKRSMC